MMVSRVKHSKKMSAREGTAEVYGKQQTHTCGEQVSVRYLPSSVIQTTTTSTHCSHTNILLTGKEALQWLILPSTWERKGRVDEALADGSSLIIEIEPSTALSCPLLATHYITWLLVLLRTGHLVTTCAEKSAISSGLPRKKSMQKIQMNRTASPAEWISSLINWEDLGRGIPTRKKSWNHYLFNISRGINTAS